MSACAVCDGALPIFRDKPLVVIGGGDLLVRKQPSLQNLPAKYIC